MIYISVIIPTVRDISLNEECLARQTFGYYEVIVVRPEGKTPEGLFYTLNRDYNRALRQAKGSLIVSYQDMIEIKPDTLERFWTHYQLNKKICVGALGDQYSSLNPPIKVWEDPRRNSKSGSFYECYPNDIEFTLCAIPRKAFFEVGGFDEEYDKGAAVGEKELMNRIDKAGYKSYLDQSIDYKAIKHDRLTKDWDRYYQITSEMYSAHLQDINRLKLDYLQMKDYTKSLTTNES